MRQTAINISTDQARQYLATLDLSYIVRIMCDENYPLPRWTITDARECGRRYKNFLLLQKIHTSISLVPTRFIDEFWHNHILHTRCYLEDCQHIFGFYYHHVPAVPGENVARLIDQFERTKALYWEEFGEGMM
jgi:hypothetical protein